MNEPLPNTQPTESTPSPLPCKDRSAGLIVFGILTILLGCLAGLFVPLTLFGQAASAKAANAPVNFSICLPVILVYGMLAVALVWLGIGSIMARRWARALLLIFSWIWLVMGLLDCLFLAFYMPRILANMPHGGTTGQTAESFVMVVMFLILGVFFVILPAIWTFFYNSRHVKATCETRDPVTRWTDACPLPVLAVCLWLLSIVPFMLVMPITGHPVLPFFGMFLTGLPGAMGYLAIDAIFGFAVWLLYKLDRRGWWLTLIVLCLFMVSAILTFARHDVVVMYRLMDYPEAQIQQIEQTGMLTGNHMGWMMSLFMLPWLGWLLFIRKFFPGKQA